MHVYTLKKKRQLYNISRSIYSFANNLTALKCVCLYIYIYIHTFVTSWRRNSFRFLCRRDLKEESRLREFQLFSFRISHLVYFCSDTSWRAGEILSKMCYTGHPDGGKKWSLQWKENKVEYLVPQTFNTSSLPHYISTLLWTSPHISLSAYLAPPPPPLSISHSLTLFSLKLYFKISLNLKDFFFHRSVKKFLHYLYSVWHYEQFPFGRKSLNHFFFPNPPPQKKKKKKKKKTHDLRPLS